jgi:transposase InsO family protein
MPASTVHRVLVRHGLNRLDHLDRVTRAPIRRIVMTRPGELVHVDIKKLGRIPKGGGWRVHGRTARPSTYKKRKARIGYAYVHSAIDGYSRLAYTEVLANEQGRTASEFITRALAFFANHDITVERILTDNGPCYRGREFADALGIIAHTFTRPYRPATNGKVERFNRTLLTEWAYARPWISDGQRTRALARWLHTYNHHRYHTAIGGTPITHVGNLSGQYS